MRQAQEGGGFTQRGSAQLGEDEGGTLGLGQGADGPVEVLTERGHLGGERSAQSQLVQVMREARGLLAEPSLAAPV